MQIGAIEMQNGSPIDMFIHKLNILKQQQLNFTYKNFQTHSLGWTLKTLPWVFRLAIYLDFPSKVNMKIFL